MTEAELKVMVDEVESEGSINRDESDLIKAAIEFNDVRVKEILTPRVDMVACNITDSNAEIYRLFPRTTSPACPSTTWRKTTSSAFSIRKTFSTPT